jgi:NAD dependent epimerase/dehydratase family enzyme
LLAGNFERHIDDGIGVSPIGGCAEHVAFGISDCFADLLVGGSDIGDLEREGRVADDETFAGGEGRGRARAGDTAVDETAPAGSDFLADVCVEWEAAAAPAIAAGIRVPFLRTGIVLTADGGALAKMLPLFRFGLGGRMGSGKQWWSWISMADEIGAIRWLIDNDISGPVNATAPTPVTNREFTKALGEAMHRPTLAPVPSFGPKLLLGAELADALLFTSTRVLPASLTASGYSFAHPTIDVALQDVLTSKAAA